MLGQERLVERLFPVLGRRLAVAKREEDAEDVVELLAMEVELLALHGLAELDPRKLVDWMLEDGVPARLSLQIHKFIWEPQKKGV